MKGGIILTQYRSRTRALTINKKESSEGVLGPQRIIRDDFDSFRADDQASAGRSCQNERQNGEGNDEAMKFAVEF